MMTPRVSLKIYIPTQRKQQQTKKKAKLNRHRPPYVLVRACNGCRTELVILFFRGEARINIHIYYRFFTYMYNAKEVR